MEPTQTVQEISADALVMFFVAVICILFVTGTTRKLLSAVTGLSEGRSEAISILVGAILLGWAAVTWLF